MKSKPLIITVLSALLLVTSAGAEAWHGGRVGVGIGFAPYYYGGYYGGYGPYGYPGYGYYPYYANPPTVIYTAPAQQYNNGPQYWYYCPPARAYYPYVNQCPSGWQAVPVGTTQPRQAARAPARMPAGKITFSLGDVLFATGKSELRPAAVGVLDSVVNSIRKYSGRPIRIEGYTDSRGGDEQNLALSQHRADRVKEYLVAHGIPAEHINAIGEGKANPVADNSTRAGRQRNRRVNIIID